MTLNLNSPKLWARARRAVAAFAIVTAVAGHTAVTAPPAAAWGGNTTWGGNITWGGNQVEADASAKVRNGTVTNFDAGVSID